MLDIKEDLSDLIVKSLKNKAVNWVIILSIVLQATLHSGISLQDCVKLPPGEDPNDWVAVHGEYEL